MKIPTAIEDIPARAVEIDSIFAHKAPPMIELINAAIRTEPTRSISVDKDSWAFKVLASFDDDQCFARKCKQLGIFFPLQKVQPGFVVRLVVRFPSVHTARKYQVVRLNWKGW